MRQTLSRSRKRFIAAGRQHWPEALALSDVESQQGPEAAWGAWDEMMGYSDAIEHELIDRHNAVAWASGDGHAIPR